MFSLAPDDEILWWQWEYLVIDGKHRGTQTAAQIAPNFFNLGLSPCSTAAWRWRRQTARHRRPHCGCLIFPNLLWEKTWEKQGGGGKRRAAYNRFVATLPAFGMSRWRWRDPQTLMRASQGERCGPRAPHLPPPKPASTSNPLAQLREPP